MPSFRLGLTEREHAAGGGYVLSLSRSAARPGTGNARARRRRVSVERLRSCHVVDGRGGILGPELTGIGGRRGAAYLREAIVKPAASHPPGYLVVRAVPASGAEVRGIRVNEDVFWIHIRDAGGNVHSLQKSELTRVDRELDATLMPSYESRLSARAARRSGRVSGDAARCEDEARRVAGTAACALLRSRCCIALAVAAAAHRTASG